MNDKNKTPMTAEQLLQKLAADPQFQARSREKELQFEAREVMLREAEKPLVEALNRVGLQVKSAWDLVNSKTKYVEAIPILLEHLQRRYPDWILNGIARALAIREAKFAWPSLVVAFKKTNEMENPAAKQGLAAALYVTSDDRVIDEVIDLLKDSAHGESRILLLRRLKKSKKDAAKDAIEKLRSDPTFSKEINSWRR